MPNVVITNAAPLIALAKLNLLHLLKQLYFGQIEEWSDIWISPALCHRILQDVLG
jgi:hypothetical protein